jgi:DNA-repair protein complementing XP-A cells
MHGTEPGERENMDQVVPTSETDDEPSQQGKLPPANMSSMTMMTTTLTQEQKERMEQNRLRALEIQRQRRLRQEQEQQQQQAGKSTPPLEDENEDDESGNKRRKMGHNSNINNEHYKKETIEKDKDEDVELEDFEQGAPDLVTKREAMQMYCLPQGTLAVCQFVTKENPHRKGWTPMKLYHRQEIRKRARKRFGGLPGLVEERRKRQERQFRNDMERSKRMFERKSTTTTTTRSIKKT